MVRVSTSLLLVLSFVIATAQLTFAQTDIGAAVRVENRVEGQLGDDKVTKTVQSRIFQNETLRTYPDSAATFELADGTKMSLGSGSEIVLDRFVYDPDTSSGDIVLSAVKGAFRFVSGSAKDNSYRFLTSVAAVGIRGTDFDLYSTSLITLVLSRYGAPYACPRRLQNDLGTNNVACCNLDVGEGGTPVYGIITRRNRYCSGPHTWTGTNPYELMKRALAREDPGLNDDDEDGDGRPPRNDSPPLKSPPQNSGGGQDIDGDYR